MNERAWQQAWKAQTLAEAHTALVALRPAPKAGSSAWRAYHLRSSSVYRQVAQADQHHQGHALYWADREKAKADKLNAESATCDAQPAVESSKKRGSKNAEIAVMPTSLEHAHELLRAVRPAAQAGPEWWLAYHRHAAAVYAEMSEVDRAHHHEALFWAGLERDKAAEVASQLADCEAREPVTARCGTDGGRIQ